MVAVVAVESIPDRVFMTIHALTLAVASPSFGAASTHAFMEGYSTKQASSHTDMKVWTCIIKHVKSYIHEHALSSSQAVVHAAAGRRADARSAVTDTRHPGA